MNSSKTAGDGLRFSNIRLGIVCPMANERPTAVEFVNAVLGQCKGFKSVMFFVVFDNACKDGTVDLLKELQNKLPQLKVIWAPEDRCVVDAYVRGYREALNADCDWILEIDASFSHHPSQIPQFFDKMAEGFDCVFGSRFCKGGKFTEAPLSRYFISYAGSAMTNLLLGTKLKDMTSGFEMFTNAALRKVLEKGISSRGHFFQTEIKTYCRNMRIVEVPIHYRAPSQNVNFAVIIDAFSNLFRLFRRRLTGNL
ncbi:MAG: glycosyltransferase [Phycisphaerae bacterium]|nr:glycosyltransferase [Phycisphaerae bacterium]MDD5381432.1 glycosyltransferase [Phycisphaerae bacterium]